MSLPWITPPTDLLEKAVETNDLEPLQHWFIAQTSPGYSFEFIVEFIAEQRSKNAKPKAKRAPSTTRKTRKAATTKKMEMTQL